MGKSKLESHIRDINYDNLERLVNKQAELSYKDLCTELGIQRLEGNSKSKQLLELSTICNYEKNGTKFKFLSLCSREELTLFNNRSVYLPYIEYLIINVFSQYSKLNPPTIFVTYSDLLYKCNLMNKNYKNMISGEMKERTLAMAMQYGFDYDNYFDYIDKGYISVLKPIMQSALKSLVNRKLINVNTAYTVWKTIEVDGNASTIFHNVLSTDPLGAELLKVEREAFDELHIKDVTELYGSKKYFIPMFYNLCNSILKEKCEKDETFIKNGWKFVRFSRCMCIVINAKAKDCQILNAKDELNAKIKQRMLTTKSLDFLTNYDRKKFIEATIDKDGEKKYKFTPRRRWK